MLCRDGRLLILHLRWSSPSPPAHHMVFFSPTAMPPFIFIFLNILFTLERERERRVGGEGERESQIDSVLSIEMQGSIP